MTQLPHIPASIWALAMDWLPMKDVLNCSIVNHCFLSEVSPQVTCLRIAQEPDKALLHPTALMGIKASKRFPNVEYIKVDFRIGYPSPKAVAIFLLQFPKLQRVEFTEKTFHIGGNFLPSQFIRAICQAYSTGDLQEHVVLDGLMPRKGFSIKSGYFGARPGSLGLWVGWRCFGYGRSPEHGCGVCELICQSFPPRQVLDGTLGVARCFPVENQLELAYQRARNVNLTELLEKVLMTQKQVHKGIFWYSDSELARMNWLVKKGAKLSILDLSNLMAATGATKIDQRFYESLGKWGLTLPARSIGIVGHVRFEVKHRKALEGCMDA